MTLRSIAKFKEKLLCGFKYDMRNLVNFHLTTLKLENFTKMGFFCPKYIRFGFVCVMTLKVHARFKGKLTRGMKNDIRIWLIFIRAVWKSIWKSSLWWAAFVQTIWRFRWKSREELCLMTLKSDAKFEEKLTLCSKKWFGEF